SADFLGPMSVPDFESLDDGSAESEWPGSAHATFWPVAAAIPTPTATTARPKRRDARLPCALRRACTAINVPFGIQWWCPARRADEGPLVEGHVADNI